MEKEKNVNDFIAHFERDGKKIYREKIAEALASNGLVVIDFVDIMQYDADFAKECMEHPREALEALERAVRNVVAIDFPQFASQLKIPKVGITNLPDIVPLREITVDLLGKLFATKGVVVRVSERKNFLTRAAFQDESGHITHVDQESENMEYPERCEETWCENRRFTFVPELSTFVDYQKVRIQEVVEEVQSGQLPRGHDVVMMGNLIDVVRPGDVVIIVGILRPVKDRTGGNTRSRVFLSEIECVSATILDKDKDITRLSNEDIEKIKEMARKEGAYEQLINSIAPAILGHEDVKEAILLQLAGGVPMTFPDGTRRRGDIHVMLIGDAGLAKSEILQFASKVAPRSMLASGKGSSAAGLSAAMVKERDVAYLEVGVLPLVDGGGLACIDEADKMRPEDRSALHEAMEQQTITYNKGGFHVVLNTRASVLAALNPIAGVYDPNLSLVENIRLPPTLISRFDIIKILRDIPREEHDTEVAKHVLVEHQKESYGAEPPIPMSFLKKWVIYAKQYVKPKLTEGASAKLQDYYILLRKKTEPNQIPVTVRTLESLIRLATARAKIVLHDEVTEEDAERAILLMNRMFAEVLTDPLTKQLDVSVLVGMSGQRVSREMAASKALRAVIEKSESGLFSKRELVDMMVSTGMDEDVANKMFQWLLYIGRIYEAKSGHFKGVGSS